MVVTIAVYLILYFVPPKECPENARYILSAISQGLAAVLALVFTITLVVAQMTRRYTAMDKIVFRRETLFLMIVLGFGVVTPLLVLNYGLWQQGVNLSIAVAVFCVFSLLPFLKGVNSVLKYEIGVRNLYENSMRAVNLGGVAGDEAGAEGGIGDLAEIGKSAVKESREQVVTDIIRLLTEIGKNVRKRVWEMQHLRL